jgi:hypothetical protein
VNEVDDDGEKTRKNVQIWNQEVAGRCVRCGTQKGSRGCSFGIRGSLVGLENDVIDKEKGCGRFGRREGVLSTKLFKVDRAKKSLR